MTQILEFTSEILSFLFPGNSPLEFFIWLCLFFFLASVHLPEDMAIYFVQILAKHGLLEYNIHKDAGETFGGNTRWLFLKHPKLKAALWGGHMWNPSYFVATVSERSKSQIISYIENQKLKP